MAIPGFRGLSLREFGLRLYRNVNDHAAPDTAAQLSYYALFSLFPFLVFLATLTAWLPLKGSVNELLGRLGQIMPDEALALVRTHLDDLLDNPRPKLLTLGVVVTLWSASRGIDALRKALNLAYDVKESRSFWRTQSMALVLTVAEAVVILACVAMVLLGGQAGLWLAEHAGVGREFQFVWSWLRWPVTALVFTLAVAVSYYFLPDVKQEFRYITPGSVVSTVIWLLGTWAFTLYAEHFGSYNVTYGSIGSVVVLMTWFYISGLVLILGGEMNAIIEHASRGGKDAGARAAGEAPPPEAERPSAMPPGAVKSPEVAKRTEDASARRSAP